MYTSTLSLYRLHHSTPLRLRRPKLIHHLSLDTAVNSATSAFAAFSSLRDIPSFKANALPKPKTPGSPKTSSANLNAPTAKGSSELPSKTSSSSTGTSRWGSPSPKTPPTPTTHRVVATSPTTGCTISAPICPPAHYPLPTPPVTRNAFDLQTPNSTSARRMSMSTSTKSSSTTSSTRSSVSSAPPPKWAQPPTHTNSITGTAMSRSNTKDSLQHLSRAQDTTTPSPKSTEEGASSAVDPETNQDFDPELFEGQEGEPIEIVKGTEGRIAVKSTPKEYIVMVWLPGFS
jgi:hypothetical protein